MIKLHVEHYWNSVLIEKMKALDWGLRANVGLEERRESFAPENLSNAKADSSNKRMGNSYL